MFCCTISVSEGNYDFPGHCRMSRMRHTVALFPFLKGITTWPRYDVVLRCVIVSVALFPFLKGITTRNNVGSCRKNREAVLHYFRFWRELRPSFGADHLATIFLICCTISVSEGNYDISPVCLFPPLHLFVALFPFLKGITTYQVVEVCHRPRHIKLHYFRFWRELRHLKSIFNFLRELKLLHYFRFWRELRPTNYSLCKTPKTGDCCTISVSEGNYDLITFLSLFWV